jgi:photosystem II stability/assembly factor-like uncharacterized protein
MKRAAKVLASLLAAMAFPQASAAQADRFEALSFRHVGPVGNRVSAVVGVPGDPDTVFLGAASGGVFRSRDGGVHWEPVFDDQPVASIGALAIAPSDPNVIWAGTGEAKIRSNISVGNGVYRSTDGGDSWTHLGLEATGRVSRIVVHPDDPDVALVAALGHCYGPQPARGVFKTTDGGASWRQVLFVDESTGASDLVMDPNNPRLLFAGTWQMQISTWGRESGGPGSGLYASRDGGETWRKLGGHGLPEPPWGKVALAMTPRDSSRVYALIETNANRDFAPLGDDAGLLWRSDDGGRSWKRVSSDHTLTQRPHYYGRVVAAPDDADEVHFLATRHTTSLDGGVSYFLNDSGWDHHDMWIDSLIPDRMVVGHDQGISLSSNRGKSWHRPQLPIAQMYHVYTDDRVPYFLYGNRQDGPSSRGPSNSLTRGDIPIGAWHSVGGCESGFAVPDPEDPDVVWSGCYEGILERYDRRTGHARNVSVWPDNPEGWPAAPLRYRFQWTFPVAISPHDHERVYAGSQHVHVTEDGGHSWRAISPDLTTDDETRQQKSGGLTPDDASPTYAAVLFALAESPLEEGLIWAGTNDGLVHLTRDGGETWTQVTEKLPGLPPWGTVSNIEPSRHAAGTAYLSVDLHQVNDTRPYIYRTRDHGASWRRITDGIPESTHSYVHVVREDPVRPGLLYAGTENALYVSFDDGASWSRLEAGLPPAPVHWLTVQERFGDLVVATYGRGFWILDDITPLQQLAESDFERERHLLAPRPAWRFRFEEPPNDQPEDPAAGRNPEYGAALHYLLKQDAADDVVIEILDEAGVVIRSLGVPDPDADPEDSESALLPKSAGLHRVHWDLRHEASGTPKLRTKPEEHSHVEIPDRGWRPLVEAGPVAPLAAPGRYTVRLRIGARTLSQPLEVLKDPVSAGSDAELRRQVELLLEIRDHLDEVVAMIDEIEWLRKQIDDLEAMHAGREAAAPALAEAAALDGELRELEAGFFDLRLTGGHARQDSLRWPRRLYSKLASLAGYIGGSDYPPTTQQLEVMELYREQLASARARLAELRSRDVAALNATLGAGGLGRLVAGLAWPVE